MSRELELYSYVTLITPFSPMVEVTVRYILIVAASLLTFIATLSSSFILATNMYLLKTETKYITDKELKKSVCWNPHNIWSQKFVMLWIAKCDFFLCTTICVKHKKHSWKIYAQALVLCSGVPCQPSREVTLYPMHLQLVKFFITCCSLWSCWYTGDSVICTHCSQGTSLLNRLLGWLVEHLVSVQIYG